MSKILCKKSYNSGVEGVGHKVVMEWKKGEGICIR